MAGDSRPDSTGPRSGDPQSAPLSEEAVARLLGLGLSGVSELVQSLCLRLSAPDSADWRRATANRFHAVGSWDELSALPLSELSSMKDRGKSQFVASVDHEDRIAALWIYLLAIGLAGGLHQSEISTRSPAELSQNLLALAEVLPDPWRTPMAVAGLRYEEQA